MREPISEYERRTLRLRELTTWAAVLSFLLLLALTVCVLAASVRLSQLSGALETIAADMANVSGQLAAVDWEELAQTFRDTADTTGQGLAAVMAAIEDLDVQALNEAVTNLGEVISPLADFVAKFS